MELIDYSQIIQLDLPATYQYLNVLSGCIDAILERMERLSEKQILAYKIKLAIHETCTNIVKHSYQGHPGRISVQISICKNPLQLIVDLHDSGQAFVLPQKYNISINDTQFGGYGLFLIYELLDGVNYSPQSGNNHWRLVKNL